ncbi:MAG: hypothetical protein ABW189_09370 [Rickettsiales bacterium]
MVNTPYAFSQQIVFLRYGVAAFRFLGDSLGIHFFESKNVQTSRRRRLGAEFPDGRRQTIPSVFAFHVIELGKMFNRRRNAACFKKIIGHECSALSKKSASSCNDGAYRQVDGVDIKFLNIARAYAGIAN